ncbi:MAG: prolipoprotein diacylglyceryl transferase family protein, partial [Chloroflexota bacterium]
LLDLLLWCGGTAVLLGRAGFIWGQRTYFSERPEEIWQLWQGGFAYHGALLGGLLGLWLWHRRQSPRPAILTDLAPTLAILHLFGWSACLLEGCAYGQETTLGLLAADLSDDFGVTAVRYQTQALGILFSLLIFAIAWWKPSFWLTLALLSLLHAGLTFLRGDPMLQLGTWRLDTLLSLAIALIALFLLKYQRQRLWLAENS